MTRYEYGCPSYHRFEVTRPMGTAAAEESCPVCGGPATRIYTAPARPSAGSPLARAREVAERSAHEPQLRGRPSPSAAGRPSRLANPLHARLPRP